MLNIRLFSRLWRVTVCEIEDESRVILSAFNERFKVGVQEEITSEQWVETAQEHRQDLLRSLATISLLHHAPQLRWLTEESSRALDKKSKNQASSCCTGGVL